MRRSALILALAWAALCVSSSFGAYGVGTQWNYLSQYSENEGYMGLGATDSEGNRTFEYRYGSYSALPGSTVLMGGCHTWSGTGWQPGRDHEYSQRINRGVLHVGNAEGVQIHWVAPVSGYYRVEIVAGGIWDNGWATQQIVWIAGTQVDRADWLGTGTGSGNAYGYRKSRVYIAAGERVAFGFSPWGSTEAGTTSFDMTITKLAETYPEGYVWQYSTLYSQDASNGNAGTCAEDLIGNRPFEYRYSSYSATPDGSALMGSCHTWSGTGWQKSNDVEYPTRIIGTTLVSQDSDAVQVHWVAPVSGLFNVSLIAANITDNGWASLQKVWVNGELKAEATWLGSDTGHGDIFTFEGGSNIQLSAGDRVAFLFATWGSSYAQVGSFDMTVTLIEPQATMTLDCGSNIGTVKSKLAGVSQGGDTSSYLRSDIVDRLKPLGLKFVRLEAVPGNAYYDIYDPDTGTYNWTTLDAEIETIKSTGAEIILDIFYMPQWLSDDPDGNWRFTLPSSMSRWKTLISAIVRHVNIEKGYNIKYWEFWNEPSGVWAFQPWDDLNGQYKFANFYAETAKAIRSVDSTALVGGFGDNCSGTSKFTTFFAYCKLLGASIDFLSVHLYADWNANGLENPSRYYSYPNNVDAAYYDAYGKHVPVFMTEWNSESRTPLTTRAEHAAFMASALYWMQKSVVEGACFFRVQNYLPVDRSVMDGALMVRSAGRVLQMWAALPSELSSMSSDASTGITTVVSRTTGKVVAMVSRYDRSGSTPVTLKVQLSQHGLNGTCRLTRYVEDAATEGQEGALVSRSTTTMTISASETVDAYVTLDPYSVAMVVLEDVNAPALSVSPTSRSVDLSAGTTTFTINNVGTVAMPWSAEIISGVEWVTFASDPTGNIAAAENATVTLSFTENTTLDTPRTATIRIHGYNNSAEAANSPTDVTITQAAPSSPLVTTGSVTGVVTLSDFDGETAGVPVTVTLIPSVGSASVYTEILSSTGSFSIGGVTPGTYTICVQGTHWLSMSRSVTVVAGADKDAGTFALMNGDVNGDNFIDELDMTDMFGDWYNSPPSVPGADLNGDDFVDELDMNIMFTNWYYAGE